MFKPMRKLLQKKDEQSLAFGGQALIEGIMMRSRKHMVMCVRQPDDEIMTFTNEINSVMERHRALALPFIRGTVSIFETLYLGIKGLFFSANVALGEEEDFTTKEFAIALILGLAVSSLFVVIPYFLTSFLKLTGVIFNIVEALVRLGIFVLYVSIISRWGEFKRMLQYHGAEHKAINAHEAGIDLNVENVRKLSRLNPRCGTSFIFLVILVSIVIYSIMPSLSFFERLAYRLVLIPVISSISYELLRLSDRHRESPIIKIITIPGLAFQKLTTREPDDNMIEIAIKAVDEVKRLQLEK